MCGIAGAVALNGSDPQRGLAGAMRDTLLHRGPDGTGEHEGPGVSLAACRLAIVDLEPRGVAREDPGHDRLHERHDAPSRFGILSE